MLTDEKLAQLSAAARTGAALMDKKGPDRWAWRVDTDTLCMSSPYSCVIGQSMPGLHYADALETLGLNIVSQVGYGFAMYGPPETGAWDALTEAWRCEIQARTTTPAPVDEQETLTLAV